MEISPNLSSCALPAADRIRRLAEIDDLLITVAAVERVGNDLRIHFVDGPCLAERIDNLIEREKTCCPFFTFAAQPSGRGRIVDISAPPEQQAILDGLLTRAREQLG